MTSVAQGKELGPLDVKRIMDFLPHRYPFLLVDRVVKVIPNQMVDAYKNVSYNEGFFQGHFPGLPVMPGVLMVEALAQAAGIMVLSGMDEETAAKTIFLFSGIESVRFRRPVYPGDRLDLHCELTRQKMKLWKMRSVASVEGQVACEGEMTAAITLREAL